MLLDQNQTKITTRALYVQRLVLNSVCMEHLVIYDVNWNCYDDIPQGVVIEEWKSRLKAVMYGCYCAVVVFVAQCISWLDQIECLRYNLSRRWYQKLNWGTNWAMMKRLCFDFRSRWSDRYWRNIIVYTWRNIFLFLF